MALIFQRHSLFMCTALRVPMEEAVSETFQSLERGGCPCALVTRYLLLSCHLYALATFRKAKQKISKRSWTSQRHQELRMCQTSCMQCFLTTALVYFLLRKPV